MPLNDPLAASGPTVGGLGLAVFDQQVFLPAFPPPDAKVVASSHRTQVGGPVPTALAQLRRFGFACRLRSVWGDDAAGRELETHFERTGIGYAAAACRIAPATGFAQVWVEQPTGRRTLVSAPPAVEPDTATAAAFGRSARVLHLDGWGGAAAIAAAEACRQAGGGVTLDTGSPKPTTAALLRLASVVNAPRSFVRSFCGTDDPETAARSLLALGPTWVTITDGPAGAGLYAAGFARWRPAFAVPVIDTNGAGDVFCGGLIAAFLRRLSPGDALDFASATAAVKVSRPGNDALPTREEVERLLT